MNDRILGNYLKVHRRRAGLTQRELGQLVGYNRAWQVSRHERSQAVPPLLIALAYQEVLGMPVTALFTGMHATVAQAVQRNLAAFRKKLEAGGTKGRKANEIARKLQWLTKRKIPA